MIQKGSLLTTDVSEHSISEILSQERHPIMYSSRRLTNAEFNYSNVEKNDFGHLIGKKFLLRSDHRPLEFIFHSRKELPKVTTSRIQRLAIRLLAFEFDIEYVKGNSIPHVAALSRLWFYKESKDKTEEEFEHTFITLGRDLCFVFR